MTVTTADVELAGRSLPWWAPVLGLSLIAAAFAYAAGVSATRRLGSKVASFVGLTEVLFSLVFAWFLLGELPLPVQLLGGVFVVAGVVAVRYDELRAADQDPDAEPEPVTVTLSPAEP
jgi:drug/metabolite transporter (DMT)-like permease